MVSLTFVPWTFRRFSFFHSLIAAKPFVGDVFREVEIQLDDAGQVLEFLHALIGDSRQRKIQVAQIRQLVQPAQIACR